MTSPAAARGSVRSPSITTLPAGIRTADVTGVSAAFMTSYPRGIGLWQIDLVAAPAFQRLERVGPVDVHDGGKLLRQLRREVVAGPLGLGPIDDADGALGPWPGERGGNVAAGQRQDEGRHLAFVRGHAHGKTAGPVALSGELAEIQLAQIRHARGARVAQMRVVRP